MKHTRISIAIIFLGTSTVLLSGCDLNGINNSIQKYISGNKDAINQAEKVRDQAVDYNPVFESEEDQETTTPVAKEVDEITRSALTAVFAGVKMVAGGDTDTTPFILRYVTKRRINQEDGKALYQELLNRESRPKEGGLPNFFGARNTLEMSVSKDIGGRSYIIAIVMDLSEQVIWVNVY